MTTNCVTLVKAGGKTRWSAYTRGEGMPSWVGIGLIEQMKAAQANGTFAEIADTLRTLEMTDEDPFDASFGDNEYLFMSPAFPTPNFSEMLSLDHASWIYEIDLDAQTFKTYGMVTWNDSVEVSSYPLNNLPDETTYLAETEESDDD